MQIVAPESRREDRTSCDLAAALRERVKELGCLYGISDVVERAGGSIEQICEETVRLLVRSWQYPEITCSRIVMGGREYRTSNYADSPWKQTAALRLGGQPVGHVEVGYLEDRPVQDEGPFLAEERKLLHAVAERLGHVGERIRAERLLCERERELRGRLADLNRVGMLGELASSIAHEVNQPLGAIATYAEACRRMVISGRLTSPEVVDVLSKIEHEALRAGNIVHQLRDLARQRAGDRELCDVNALIRDVENLAAVDSRLHDVRLRMDLADTLPPVLADGVQIQQVVLNLIRNGVEAMQESEPEEKEVLVRTRQSDGANIRVCVTDHGRGLSKEVAEKVFQPFFTTKTDGMGIGLSLCRSIVALHGGSMGHAPSPGGGATFYFTLPAEREKTRGTT